MMEARQMRWAIFVVGLVLSASTSAAPNPRAEGKQCFHEGSSVRLNGTVVRRRFYGPPNYGETPRLDRPETVSVLKLTRPILPCDLPDFDNVKGDNGAPVRAVQIESATGQRAPSHAHTLVGTIRHSAIGPEFLDYVLAVP